MLDNLEYPHRVILERAVQREKWGAQWCLNGYVRCNE
jgi:hypothetical protein